MFELLPLQESGGLLEFWAEGNFIEGIIRTFMNPMGPAFVVWVLVAFGGSFAVYSRSPAPLVVVSVIVGGMAAPVLPGLGSNVLMLIAIGAGASALWTLYQGVGQ
ncbi:hypothetical protein [Halorussus pelagicus]|uniref:hypothetical protein n=1 Tax=Halorussus pelagicus TaxID=2505977 RepID=UPI000FFCB85D|nr:hypothetical protein [Halorussus pelagicus]